MGWQAELGAMFLALLLASVIVPMLSLSVADYLILREKLMKSEYCSRMGAGQQLNTNEKMVSRFLLMEKHKTISRVRMNGSRSYVPAGSFFLSRKWMSTTAIFNIIKRMPKGAAIHLHELALTSINWLISNITYRDNVFMCVGKHGYLKFAVFRKLPTNPDCKWRSVKQERAASKNAGLFNDLLKKNLSLLTTDPVNTFKTSHAAWERLQIYKDQVVNLIRRPTILKDYLKQAVKEFVADNVQFMEVRATLTGMQDEDGNHEDPKKVLEMFEDVADDTASEYNSFLGMRIIQASPRYNTYEEVLEEVKLALQLRDTYSGIHLGFDLDGYENASNPLIYYIEALLYPSQQSPAVHLPYFFHASETKWFGTDADMNLVDAVLLNATRIGHAYSLLKYLKAARIIKSKQIGVEINPISNQVMGLVKDFRNHAVIPLLSTDAPLMISSDYPAAWEALPLSHDFYVAFMAMCAQNSGLSFLKQLAVNSIGYSALSGEESAVLYKLWSGEWEKFIINTIDEYGLTVDSFTEMVEYGDVCWGVRTGAYSSSQVPRNRLDLVAVFSICLSCIWTSYKHMLLV